MGLSDMGSIDGKRILVAGGSGFIGGNLVARLVRRGCRVRATYRRPIAQSPREPVEWVRAELTRPEDCARAVRDIDVVFQCAASTSGAAVIVQRPLVHVTPNVVMNALLLEAAHAAGVQRLVYLSSAAAYPPAGERPVSEDEMFTGEPYSKYYPAAAMKRFAETLCEMYARRIRPSMSTVVVRPSNVYGPHDKFDPERSHVTAALVRKVADRSEPIEVWGTGEDVRDLVYIDDFLDGLMLASETDRDFFAVNVGSGEGTSVREILTQLLEIDGRPGTPVRFDPTKPTTIPVLRVDISRAREVLGYRPQVPLAEGLRRTLTWYRREHRTPSALRQAS
jgi:GDP-L-fucose synthase